MVVFCYIKSIELSQFSYNWSIKNIEKKFNGEKVVTFIRKFEKFYPAENYHQDYYQESFVNYLMYKKACGRTEQLKKIWQ